MKLRYFIPLLFIAMTISFFGNFYLFTYISPLVAGLLAAGSCAFALITMRNTFKDKKTIFKYKDAMDSEYKRNIANIQSLEKIVKTVKSMDTSV